MSYLAYKVELPHILIVDDDPGVRELLRDLLRVKYDCAYASSGQEALACIEKRIPDLVLSDIKMDDMNGLELVRKLSDSSPDTVAVMISGTGTVDNAVAAIRVGAYDFIQKPFNVNQVEMAIERALHHRRMLVEKRRYEKQLEKLVQERTRLLNFLTNYDPLTGLPNRLLFEDRLGQAILQNEPGMHLVVLLISPNRFDEFRDTLHHAESEAILKELASRIVGYVHPSHTVARLEGDKFAIFLPQVRGRSEIETIADNIFAANQKPLMLGQQSVFVPMSIGVSIYPDDGEDVRTLMTNAGAAMWMARQSARGFCHFYSEDIHTTASNGIKLENDLRLALREREFTLLYQPKIRFADMSVQGVEALLRWKHPERGIVSPNEFITAAEKSGLITEIGNWVIREACSQGKRWQKQGVELEIAVNVSPAQFDEALGPTVRQILNDTQFDPELLNLEVTETSLLLNADTAIHGLQSLRNLGVKVSIDDFGTGYSSLRHLKILPVDVLKIDRSFVSEAIANPDDAALVTTIISLAHNLGLSVVAEGVETKEQFDFLNRMQCDYWQGYLCSRPIPPDELEALLENK